MSTWSKIGGGLMAAISFLPRLLKVLKALPQIADEIEDVVEEIKKAAAKREDTDDKPLKPRGLKR